MKKQTKLKIAFGISIAIVLFNDIIFAETPEIFGFEDKIGQLFSNFSLAFICSYFFYWVVVLSKDKVDRENINYFLLPMIEELIKYSYTIFEDIVSLSDSNVNDITKDEFIECCKKINPNDRKPIHQYGEPGNSVPMTYGLWIYINVEQTKVLVDRLFNMPFLVPEQRKMISKFTDSAIIQLSRKKQDIPNSSNLSLQAVILYELLDIIRELDAFNKKENNL